MNDRVNVDFSLTHYIILQMVCPDICEILFHFDVNYRGISLVSSSTCIRIYGTGFSCMEDR